MNDMIITSGNMPVLRPEIAAEIVQLEQMLKGLTERQKALKQGILGAMQAYGITKLETPEMLINYIAPTDRESFDSKAFQKEFPEIYDQYVRISPVAASVRIKLK